jgi:hypothetical protein
MFILELFLRYYIALTVGKVVGNGSPDWPWDVYGANGHGIFQSQIYIMAP